MRSSNVTLLTVAGFVFSVGAALLSTRTTWQSRGPTEEILALYEEPPPPKEIEVIPPKPVQPVPTPSSPPPKEPEAPIEPPKPVFGLQEEALEETGDLAVATGNTLMIAPDSIVEAPMAPIALSPIQLDTEPEMLQEADAVYPAWAEEQGVTAKVVLMVTIDARGTVIRAELKISGGKDFDKSSLDAIKKTRFKPLVRGGSTVPAKFTFTFDFRL